MADRDDHFRLGVRHGFDDEPRYRWQDPVYQGRYDAGYDLGHLGRVTHDYDQGRSQLPTPEQWDAFEAMMQRRGFVRER